MKRFALPRIRITRATIIKFGVAKLCLIVVGFFAVTSFLKFAAEVHALRDHRSAGPEWAFPSHVYSDALAFTVGKPMPVDYLRRHLALRNYREAKAPLTSPGTFEIDAVGFEVFTRGIRDALDPVGALGPEHVRVTLEKGLMRHVQRLGGLAGIALADTTLPPRLEPILVETYSDDHDVRRAWVPLASIPHVLRDAVIASEDRRFYTHHGIDFRSNARAFVVNSRAGGVRQGASTITQQLARGLFLSRDRNVFRKVNEIFIAVGLELLLSKDEILEMYLNSIYLGQEQSGGVAGVGEAARRYFDRPVETLDLGQAATLVGMIPAPNLYSPFRNMELAKKRRDVVLHDMVEVGVLDAHEAALEIARPLAVTAGVPRAGRFPSFTGYAHEYLKARLAPGALEHSGLSIYTTLDPVWQERIEATLPHAVSALGIGVGNDSLQAAYVALDPKSGAVRAMIGGTHPQAGDFNRAFQALRQPGSAIKPVVYAAALDPDRGGTAFGAASTVPDRLRDFATAQGPWRPHNDEEEYHDTVTLAKALAKSLNVATANLVEAIEPKTVARYAERFGLRDFKPVPSIGLGTNEVTLVGITDAYTTFANAGERRDASPLVAVLGPNGKPFYDASLRMINVIPPQTAALMTGLLEDVVIFGVSNPLRKKYGFTRPVAGKTGTTNDFHDAWFVGFTPDVAAGLWVGYDTPRTLGAPAAELALPVWSKVTSTLLQGVPPTEFGSDKTLQLAWIDPWDGQLATPNCPWTMRVPFQPGTAPTAVCTRDHTQDWIAKIQKRTNDSLLAVRRDSLRLAHAPLPPVPTIASDP